MAYKFTDHKINLYSTVFDNEDYLILPIPKNGTGTISAQFKGNKRLTLSGLPRREKYCFVTFVRDPIERFWSGMTQAYYFLCRIDPKPDHVMEFITKWVFLDQHLLPQTLFLENCYQFCPDSKIRFHHRKEIAEVLKTDHVANKTISSRSEEMKSWVKQIRPDIEEWIREINWRDIELCKLIGKELHFEEVWQLLENHQPVNPYATKYCETIYREVANLVSENSNDKSVIRIAKVFPELIPQSNSLYSRFNYTQVKGVKMAGVVFWFQGQDKDVFSGRPIDLDAWRYAVFAGGCDKARCINETAWPIFFDGDFDFEIIGSHVDDLREWIKDKENVVVFQCEWSCPEDAISISDVDHSKVDWYVFGMGNNTPRDLPGQYVYLPQNGMGGLHPVHVASAVMLRRWEELTKEK